MATPPENANAGLKTRHVFLDTEVYRRYGHNLHDKVLQRLLQLTKDHISTLHITDITLEEIKRQLCDMAAEVAQAMNKAIGCSGIGVPFARGTREISQRRQTWMLPLSPRRLSAPSITL
ncbi:MAG TPA: PIN domain-containing protein [Xanthobacteraceae bacterium]|nr:PIN domain-containing protein [Xanthobacteraceae bacterium]